MGDGRWAMENHRNVLGSPGQEASGFGPPQIYTRLNALLSKPVDAHTRVTQPPVQANSDGMLHPDVETSGSCASSPPLSGSCRAPRW